MTYSKDIPVGNGIEATLPSSWYVQDRIFALEKEHIFLREWLCVGREEEIPEVGDHKVLEIFGESVIVIRNGDGDLRAHYNVCRHRGSLLCRAHGEPDMPKQGKGMMSGVVGKKSIVCPYHGWAYDLDGKLISAPHMPEGSHFDKSQVQLHPVGVGTWGGFVFLNLTPSGASPFDEFIGETAERFQRYPLKDLRVARTISYEIDANWKILCENYNECYHCGPVHPELCKIVPAFKQQGGSNLDWERGIPHREGATTFTFSGDTTRRAFPGLDEDEQVRHKGELLYPTVFLSLAKDHVATFVLHPKGPNKSTVECHFLFEPYEMEKTDFDPSDAVDFWDLVNRQDWHICERVQKGLSSRMHTRGIFVPMEDWNLDIRRYVTERIGAFVDGEA